MINLGNLSQDIQSVREYISGRGIQYPNRFLVNFRLNGELKGKANIGDCNMSPLSINLPEQSIRDISDYYYTTPRSIPTHIETGVVLMNFIIMKDWAERIFFERWMHTISYGNAYATSGFGTVIGTLPYDIASNNLMEIKLLDGGSPAHTNATYIFGECFPIQLTPVEFDSTIGGYASFQVGMFVRSLLIHPVT